MQIRVAGNIIKEISSIPQGSLALMELIKNSYEAKATNVKIKLDKTCIVIQDDGTGMNDKGIEALLQISHSNKVFGEKITGTNRYISGEKGLGFFSTFRFGRNVHLDTMCDGKQISFELDLNKLEEQENISEYDVPTESSKISENKHGTKIRISDLDYDFYDAFKKNLQKNSNDIRLCNSIDDKDFKIVIEIDNRRVESEENRPSKDFIKHRIAKAVLNNDELVVQKYDGDKKMTDDDVTLLLPNNELLNNPKFELKVNLEFYSLKGSGIKQAPRIYMNNNKLEPLIFINNVLFDSSSDLYNVEINAKLKSSYVFRQQIGKIKIFLQDPNILKFNSDRTKIVENKNLDDLKNILDFISEKSQKSIYSLMSGKKYVEKTKNTEFKNNINRKNKNFSSTSSNLQSSLGEKKDLNKASLPNKKQVATLKGKALKQTPTQTKIGSRQKYYNDYWEIPGYKGEEYEFENLYNVGHLISELRKLNIEKNPLLALITVRPMYEACKNLLVKREILDSNILENGGLSTAIRKIKSKILSESKKDLSRLCRKTDKNKPLSYSTTFYTFKNTDFASDVEMSNIFIHRIEEKVETPETIKCYLQNVLLFTVIVDRYINLKTPSKNKK